MHYSLTILEADFQVLRDSIFSVLDCEGAAYLLCKRSETESETRFLVQYVRPVQPEDYLARERLSLSIRSDSYVHVAKEARAHGWSVIAVHSHVVGTACHSSQDDAEEPRLMEFLKSRLPHLPHGSMVVSSDGTMVGRAWTGDGWEPISPIRVLGERFRISFAGLPPEVNISLFDRQVRALGEDLQRLLGQLHVGIVGAGGTGSAVAEQLTRLGVGSVSLFDGDQLEDSNVTRVYGSTLADQGRNKADLLGEHLRAIGMKTHIRIFDDYILRESVAKELRSCDVVFGCTDKQMPRLLLVQLATRYLIPVLDVGVRVSSSKGALTGVHGRVTVVLPPEACLLCRGRVTAERAAFELKSKDEQARLVKERYAKELETNAPAVVSFTTAVAAQAVSELLHRLAGLFSGDSSSEVLLDITNRAIRRNRTTRSPDCACAVNSSIAAGDDTHSVGFLGVTWVSE